MFSPVRYCVLGLTAGSVAGARKQPEPCQRVPDGQGLVHEDQGNDHPIRGTFARTAFLTVRCAQIANKAELAGLMDEAAYTKFLKTLEK